ncbi:YceD family protein [Nocardioides sp.]|uniref:YceD family protein n=1 Tax=Nocardioides sp. TaxID=35761 RepID=UPI002620C163|nr:YceD family protein [Nocardioides sp.]
MSATPHRLDPRAPFVIDTHELGRRPGSQRELTVTVPAPAELGIEMLAVPEGVPVDLDLRLEAVMEGVLVTADGVAPLKGECVRCLEPIVDEIDIHFQELYMYDDTRDAATVDENDDISLTDGELVDLEPALRDAVVLDLPLQPLCSEDCLGLCTECGFRLVEDPEHTHDAPIDPRWAGLVGLETGDEASTETAE